MSKKTKWDELWDIVDDPMSDAELLGINMDVLTTTDDLKEIKAEGDKMQKHLLLIREYVWGIPAVEATRKILKLLNDHFDDIPKGDKKND